ncbi:unnamed protein product [Mytilus coruscus]|uniref:Uncharacterized protein n=1 Tax=Mytilus coruscus TaxID=42192 RepID=A0A6J8AYE7_MYTCO|nr:unnamed protein product [Mytilus coruscus]
MCLRDVIKVQNIELCSKKIQFQRPGYKIVWSGNFDGQTCDTKRYQPISHFNLDGSNCIFQKSSCNGEGQITVEDGSPRTDRRCRCDYRRGYAFVSEPSNKCNCIPSNEDCSCYLKHCPFLHKLSPDYKCVWQDDLQYSFNCTTMLERGADGEENRIHQSKHCIMDNSADRNMLIFSNFHSDKTMYTNGTAGERCSKREENIERKPLLTINSLK